MIVGILTIHAAINYGSVLQAFALQKYLQMNNPQDDFQIIDYCPSIIMDQYSLALYKNIETPKSFIKYILSYKDRKNRGLAFEQFIKSKMKLSPRKYTSDDDLRRDEKRWDSFLLGSDQIWNPEIVGNSDIFMLGFCKDEFCGSFASSFGKLKISDEYLKKLSNELLHFAYVSVREPSAQSILKTTGINSKVVCDPVFLMSDKEWELHERRPSTLPEKYIAYYSVEKNTFLEKKAKAIAERLGIPIVDIGVRSKKSDYLGIHFSSCGPDVFLYLIHHAEIVFTNSFHGTAFCVIYKRQFICMLHKSRGTRIKELLELTDLQNRSISNNTTVDEMIHYVKNGNRPYVVYFYKLSRFWGLEYES